ncbi:hypothetical protein ACFL0V_04080, partial [Nanoarchaeota archaeon]
DQNHRIKDPKVRSILLERTQMNLNDYSQYMLLYRGVFRTVQIKHGKAREIARAVSSVFYPKSIAEYCLHSGQRPTEVTVNYQGNQIPPYHVVTETIRPPIGDEIETTPPGEKVRINKLHIPIIHPEFGLLIPSDLENPDEEEVIGRGGMAKIVKFINAAGHYVLTLNDGKLEGQPDFVPIKFATPYGGKEATEMLANALEQEAEMYDGDLKGRPYIVRASKLDPSPTHQRGIIMELLYGNLDEFIAAKRAEALERFHIPTHDFNPVQNRSPTDYAICSGWRHMLRGHVFKGPIDHADYKPDNFGVSLLDQSHIPEDFDWSPVHPRVKNEVITPLADKESLVVLDFGIAKKQEPITQYPDQAPCSLQYIDWAWFANGLSANPETDIYAMMWSLMHTVRQEVDKSIATNRARILAQGTKVAHPYDEAELEDFIKANNDGNQPHPLFHDYAKIWNQIYRTMKEAIANTKIPEEEDGPSAGRPAPISCNSLMQARTFMLEFNPVFRTLGMRPPCEVSYACSSKAIKVYMDQTDNIISTMNQLRQAPVDLQAYYLNHMITKTPGFQDKTREVLMTFPRMPLVNKMDKLLSLRRIYPDYETGQRCQAFIDVMNYITGVTSDPEPAAKSIQNYVFNMMDTFVHPPLQAINGYNGLQDRLFQTLVHMSDSGFIRMHHKTPLLLYSGLCPPGERFSIRPDTPEEYLEPIAILEGLDRFCQNPGKYHQAK